MVIYDLECHNGHSFEGWFDDKEDMEAQQAQGLLQCPVCSSTTVDRKVHPIAIKTTSAPQAGTPGGLTTATIPDTPAIRASQEAMAEYSEKMAKFVENNFENVGNKFAQEALNMHYGSSEQRNIRGTTTTEDDKALAKEGIPVFKLPVPKKDNEDLN